MADAHDHVTQIELAARTLLLQKIHYYINEGLPIGIVASSKPAALRVLLPQTVDRLLVRMIGFVFAENVQCEHVSVEFEYPSSWWQFVRATVRVWANLPSQEYGRWWLPERARLWLARLQVDTLVRVQEVKFEHFIKYPEFMPGDPREYRHEVHIAEPDTWMDRAEYGLGKPVSEVRVNGAWSRRIRVRRWWLED